MEKCIVYAGAVRGEGPYAVRELCSKGYHVILATHQKQDAEKIRQAVVSSSLPGTVDIVEGGQIPAECDPNTYQWAEKTYGAVYGIICAVGTPRVQELTDLNRKLEDCLNPDAYLHEVDHLLSSALGMTKAALPYLTRCCGSIVFVGSVEAMAEPYLGNPVEATARGCLEVLTLQLAHCLSVENVSVNCIARGIPEGVKLPGSQPGLVMRDEDFAACLLGLLEEGRSLAGQILIPGRWE